MASTATKPTKAAPKAPPRQEPDAATEQAAAPAKNKPGLAKILLLVMLPLGVVATGGGAWYLLQDEDEEAVAVIKPATAKPAPAASANPVSSKPPTFVALEPFTVNLQHDDTSLQYLQVGLSLKLTDAAVADKVKLHMPDIRNRVLLLLSGKRASEISTPEGKKTLSTELAREIVQALAGSIQAQGLDSVLFTSFVIQ